MLRLAGRVSLQLNWENRTMKTVTLQFHDFFKMGNLPDKQSRYHQQDCPLKFKALAWAIYSGGVPPTISRV